MTNGNDPINPSPINANYSTGLTKREYFAALAMQTLILNNPSASKTAVCSDAVFYADKLIKTLKTQTPNV